MYLCTLCFSLLCVLCVCSVCLFVCLFVDSCGLSIVINYDDDDDDDYANIDMCAVAVCYT